MIIPRSPWRGVRPSCCGSNRSRIHLRADRRTDTFVNESVDPEAPLQVVRPDLIRHKRACGRRTESCPVAKDLGTLLDQEPRKMGGGTNQQRLLHHEVAPQPWLNCVRRTSISTSTAPPRGRVLSHGGSVVIRGRSVALNRMCRWVSPCCPSSPYADRG